jgi:hypothetical protein
MSKAAMIKIANLEVKKRDIEKVKKIFHVRDNAEAIQKALDVATSKIELEGIFEKHKGTKIKKVYA